MSSSQARAEKVVDPDGLRRRWLASLIWRTFYLTTFGLLALVCFVIGVVGGDMVWPGEWPARRRAISGAIRVAWIVFPGPRPDPAWSSGLDRIRGIAPGWVTFAGDRMIWTPAFGGEPTSDTWASEVTGPVRTWGSPFGSVLMAVPLGDGPHQDAVLLVRRWHRRDRSECHH